MHAIGQALVYCPGVEVDAWRASNRVPVFPNQINRWLLVRTTRDNPTRDRVLSGLYDAMVRWSDQLVGVRLPSYGGERVGVFDIVKVVRAEQSRDGLPPWRIDRRIARAQDLPQGPMPTINSDGKPLLYFEVSFAYRGFHDSLPWPVARTIWGELGSSFSDQCPTSTDLMLFEAGEPLQAAPPEKSLVDMLSETGMQAVGQLGKVGFWPILGAVGIVALVAWGRKNVGV